MNLKTERKPVENASFSAGFIYNRVSRNPRLAAGLPVSFARKRNELNQLARVRRENENGPARRQPDEADTAKGLAMPCDHITADDRLNTIQPIPYGVWKYLCGGVVYFVGDADGMVKIGWTKNLRRRIGELRREAGRELHVLAWYRANRWDEYLEQGYFKHCAQHGEWFSPAPDLMERIEGLQGVCWPLARREHHAPPGLPSERGHHQRHGRS